MKRQPQPQPQSRWQDLPADRAHAMPFCGSACAACSTFFARKKSGTRVHIKGTPCGTKLLHSSSRFRTCQGETSKAVDDEKSKKKKANNLSQLQVHSDFWQTEKWIAATDMPVPNNTQRDASLKEIKQTLGPRHLKISLGRLGRHGFQNFNHIQPPRTKTPSLGSHPLWVEWAYNKRTTIIPTLQLYPSLVFWGSSSLYICISILNVCLKNVSYWIFMQVPGCSWSKLSSASKGCFNELKTFKFVMGRTGTPGQLGHKPSYANHIKGNAFLSTGNSITILHTH